MRILVTGGAGYIGSVLTRILLRRGHQVRVLDSLLHGGYGLLGIWSHPGLEFLNGDIRDLRVVNQATNGMDAVVHLAAIVGDPACARQPEVARTVNLDGANCLLESSMLSGVRKFIFASTCSNYGRIPDATQMVDENWELRPVSLYAETKVAMEDSILDIQKSNFSPTVLRFATVYGVSPRMRFDLTVNEFTKNLIADGNLEVYGEQFWRPYAHVKDVARAILEVLDASDKTVANQVFNVGSSMQNYQKKVLVDLIKPYASESTIAYVHRDEDPRDYRVSFNKIQKELDFNVEYTVEDGIAEVASLINNKVVTDFDNPLYRN